MKNQIHLIFCLLCFSALSLNGQISEQEKSMSQGLRNALILELPQTNDDFVDKLWKKYIKDFKGGKAKKNKKEDEVFIEEVTIPNIGGDNPVGLYTRISEIGDDVELTMWIDLGGAFLSSAQHAQDYLEAEKLLMRFGLEVTKEKIKIEIEKEEKELADYEKTLKKLERAHDNHLRDIEEAKEKIKKAEKGIEENKADQENTKKLIDEQKDIVRKVTKKLEDL
jgi:hypothetical protein